MLIKHREHVQSKQFLGTDSISELDSKHNVLYHNIELSYIQITGQRWFY